MKTIQKFLVSILSIMFVLNSTQIFAQRYFDPYSCDDYKSLSLRLVNYKKSGDKHFIANDSRMDISFVHNGTKILIPSKGQSREFSGKASTVFSNCSISLDGFNIENYNKYIRFYNEMYKKLNDLEGGEEYSTKMYGLPDTNNPQNLANGIKMAQKLIPQFEAIKKEIQNKINVRDVSRKFDFYNYLDKLAYRCSSNIATCYRVISDNQKKINNLNEPKTDKMEEKDGNDKQSGEKKSTKKGEDDFWSGKSDALKSSPKSEKNNDRDFWSGGEEKKVTSKNNGNSDFWKGGTDKSTSGNNIGKDGNSSGPEIVIDYKSRRLFLKNSDGGIIKEWSSDHYTYLEKIDDAGRYFKLTSQQKGSNYQAKNKYSVVDFNGKILTIDGAENFGSIIPRDEGGYFLDVYTSDSLYEENLFLGGKGLFQQSYISSAEAVSALTQFIERRKEEKIRDSKGKKGGVILGFDSKYNIIQVKEITVNAKMQFITSKIVYKILQ